MIRTAFLCGLVAAFGLWACADGARDPRERVRRLLAADFDALNRGEMTLSMLGEKTCRLAETAEPDVQEVLLSGAVRIFARAGDTNGLSVARQRLEALRPFEEKGDEAVLHLGRYGDLAFVRCPTGTVDLVLDTSGRKSSRVRLSRPYWIMKYPLTRRESSFYPPLDPATTVLDEKIWSAYINANRAMAEELSLYFTDRLKGSLPPGYVVRLPTLAEWEHAFHAGCSSGDFADLRHIHHNDELGRRIYYDYDADEPRRRKLHNAWGIGDWCPQEKVLDVIDATRLVRSDSSGREFFQVRELPALPSQTDPVFACTNEHAVSLIRMPSWARWIAAVRGFGNDWCPMRLVIAPDAFSTACSQSGSQNAAKERQGSGMHSRRLNGTTESK